VVAGAPKARVRGTETESETETHTERRRCGWGTDRDKDREAQRGNQPSRKAPKNQRVRVSGGVARVLRCTGMPADGGRKLPVSWEAKPSQSLIVPGAQMGPAHPSSGR
jgi:hypothetical protein